MTVIGGFLIGCTVVGFVWLEMEDRARARRMERESEERLAAAMRNMQARRLRDSIRRAL